jgi:hypothetical protein
VPSLRDVYEKFGFAAEAAQLLETQLGNILFAAGAAEARLLENPNPKEAADLLGTVNRQTLGQALRALHRSTDSLAHLESLLAKALRERNRLFHSFYREHNFRRNSEEGRAVMLQDLDTIHDTLLDAYKAVMRVSGVDLDQALDVPLPTTHLRI